MDAKREALVDRLYQEGLRHDEAEPDRLRRYRNLEPDAAALLAMLVRAIAARSVLEIGTSNGYSTIWLADAVTWTGGRVTSVDNDPSVLAVADQNLIDAGVRGVVDLVTADGGAHLASAADATVDFLFLDAERPEYAGWWPHPRRVLRPGGVLCVDNVLSHPDEVAPLVRLIGADPELASTTVAVGKGELLAVRRPHTTVGTSCRPE